MLSSMMAGPGAVGFGVISVVGTEAVKTGGICITKRVSNVNWFFINDLQEMQRRQLDWLSVNGNWYRGSFAKEYAMESCNGVKFLRGRLLDAGVSGCKVLGGGDDSIGGCNDGYGHGVVLETKCVGEMLAACSLHDGADAAVVI